MFDANPLTIAATLTSSGGIVALGIFGVDAIQDHPGTWIGVAGAALSTITTILVIVLQGKFAADRIEMRLRLELVEKNEAACQAKSKEQDERLKATELELATLRMAKPTSVTGFYVIAGLDEVIVDVTDGVKDVLGYRPAELIGQKIDILIPPEVQPRHQAGIEKARRTGINLSPDFAIKTQARHKSNALVNVTVSHELDVRRENMIRAEIALRGAIIE